MPLKPRQLDKKGGMLNSLARHSFGAVLLAVVIEELGLPLPIPTDFMIIFAGTTADRSLPRLGHIVRLVAVLCVEPRVRCLPLTHLVGLSTPEALSKREP